MASLVQVIVDTDSSYAGYDYSDLQTAESTEQGDISLGSGTDEYVVFECYATSGTADTVGAFDGWITESTNYIEVTGLADSNYGHRGIWDDNEYRIIETSGANCIAIYEAHFRVTGLQLFNNNAASIKMCVRDYENSDSTGHKVVSYNLAKGSSSATYNMRGISLAGHSSASSDIYNNIIYDVNTAATSHGIYVSGGTYNVYNNTIIGGTNGITRNSGTGNFINNLCQDQVSYGISWAGVPEAASGWNLIDDPTLTQGAVGGTSTDLANGSATSYGANKLNDSGGGLSAAVVGSVVENDTDSTYAYVTVVDSDTQLTLSADIFDDGNETYSVTSNIYAQPDFQSGNYLLTAEDTDAMFHGTNLYADSNLPITDDIIQNSRGSSSTDTFDIGAHHFPYVESIVDVDSGAGYDYTSLSSFESTEQENLVDTSGKQKWATCRNSSGGTDDTAFTTVGWTTAPDQYIKYWTNPTEAYRHPGYWSTSDYHFEKSNQGSAIWGIEENYVRVEGIQIRTPTISSSSDHVMFIFNITGAGDVRVEKCIIRGDTTGTYSQKAINISSSSQTVKVSNCIIYDIYAAGGSDNPIYSNSPTYVYNCTIEGGAQALREDTSGDITAINNILQGASVRSFNDVINANSGYNIVQGISEVGGQEACGTTEKTGTVTSASTDKLNDSGGGLSGITLGAIVENVDDDTHSYVTAIDSDTVLSLNDHIFDTGDEDYNIYTNRVGTVNLDGSTYLLDDTDIVAMFGGVNSYTDSNYPITDDILGNSRGSSSTDNFDIGAHHSLEYNRIIDPDSGAGYDYTAWHTWESTEQADLTTAGLGKISVATCRSTGGTADTYSGARDLNGWTTEAANYIKIWTDPTESYRHSGVWNTSKYRMIYTGLANLLTLEEDYTQVIGIQFEATGVNTIQLRFRSSTENLIEKCIVKNSNVAGGSAGIYMSIPSGSGNGYIKNNIVYDINDTGAYGIHGETSGTGNIYIYNNTISACISGISTSSGDSIAVNNLVHNCTAEFLDSGLNVLSGYNVFDEYPVADGAMGTSHETGSATSYEYAKLNDTAADFSTVQIGSVVHNEDDNTYTTVTGIDSSIKLDLGNNIFDTGDEAYTVYTNMYVANIDFNDETGDDFTLSYLDESAIFKGTNLYTDSNLPVTDDILSNSRGASTTDFFDVGAHHSLEYGRVIDPDSGAGYDYTSLNTWESNEQADLQESALNKISIATCRCTGGTADTTNFTVNGFTTTSTNYVKIWTDPAESYRHAGVYPTGNKYRFEGSGATEPIVFSDEHIRVEGISFSFASSAAAQSLMTLSSTVDFRFEKCIVKDGGGVERCYGLFNESLAAGEKVYIINNIIQETYYVLRASTGDADSFVIYNNTGVDCTNGFRGAASSLLINNICVGTSDNYYGTEFSTSSRNNISDASGGTTDCVWGVVQKSGTTTSSGTNKLIDSGGGLGSIIVGSAINAGGGSDYTYVTAVDSDTQLSVAHDVLGSSESYIIYYNFIGSPIFADEAGDNFLLDRLDEVAILKGINLYTDSNLPVTDDILGTSRGDSTTDYFDIGAHHSLEYGHVVDPDSGSGYDYTTITTFESTEQADLTVTGLNKIAAATCRSTSGGADTISAATIIEFDGWTTDNDKYIKFWTDPDEAYRHQGIYNSSYYRVEKTEANAAMLVNYENLWIDGIQIKITHTSGGYKHGIDNTTSGYTDNLVRISNNIVQGVFSGTTGNHIGIRTNWVSGSDTRTIKVWNNIIYGFVDTDAKGILPANGWTSYVYNNTIYGCYDGIYVNGSDCTAINNIMQDLDHYGYVGTFNSNSGYNVWDDTPASLGVFGTSFVSSTTTATTSGKLEDDTVNFISLGVQKNSLIHDETGSQYTYVVAVDSATVLDVANDYFVDGDDYTIYTNKRGEVTFQNEGSDEFLLGSSDTVAKDNGVDLSSDTYLPFSTDILGTTRPVNSVWDAGAHEYPAGGVTINFAGTISPVTLLSATNIYRIMNLSDTISAAFSITGVTLYRTMDLTGTIDTISSLTCSEITIIYVLNPVSGGLAWGEETPTESEIAAPWSVWSDGAGGTPTITGDQDWGILSIDTIDEGRSNVYDFGNSVSRTYTLTLNRYGSGTGTPVVQIRGQNTSFLQDDGSPSWETYSAPVAKTWRYVQVRIDYS